MPKHFVVLVCGGRDFTDRRYAYGVFDAVNLLFPVTRWVQGGAQGADKLIRQYTRRNKIPGVELVTVKADWDRHGRRAGPIRNSLILQVHTQIDLVVAFPGGKGTHDMVNKCLKKKLRILDLRR